MKAAGTTVWPNDVVIDPQELFRDSPHRLVCFLLSPFEPRDVYDQVHAVVSRVCGLCEKSAGIEIEFRRADTLHESKTIHDDIWRHIAGTDLLVVDVTGLNPNVMIEYGVAAALRRPQQVILIRSEDDQSHLPFNAFAQRCLTYHRSIMGDQTFIQGLLQSMIQAITPAPFSPISIGPTSAKGFTLDMRQGDRPDLILSPSITHRRIADDGLEFGSFYVFRNSWLLLTGADYNNVRARISFRFQNVLVSPENAFLGISLRNQHFHANWGHMVLLRASGRVICTQPENDLGKYHDVDIGPVPEFDYGKQEFIDLMAEIDNNRLALSVGSLSKKLAVSDMPHVYGAGKIRISIAACRVRIREIELTPL